MKVNIQSILKPADRKNRMQKHVIRHKTLLLEMKAPELSPRRSVIVVLMSQEIFFIQDKSTCNITCVTQTLHVNTIDVGQLFVVIILSRPCD